MILVDSRKNIRLMASLFFLGYEDEIEHSISKEPVIETPVKTVPTEGNYFLKYNIYIYIYIHLFGCAGS